MTTAAKRLKDYRELLGLTQGAFAKWLNDALGRHYDKALVCKWETGAARVPAIVATRLSSLSKAGENRKNGIIVAVANQKGGVGKTVTVVNIAALLAAEGKRVLVVDCDPQANATLHFGLRGNELASTHKGLSFAMFKDEPLRGSIIPVCDGSIDLVPSNSELCEADGMLLRDPNGILTLREKLDEVRCDYDFIICDTPPTQGVLMVSALNAADHLLIPAQPEMMSFDGISKILESVAKVRRRVNPNLQLLGFLPNLCQPNRQQDREILPRIQALGPKYRTRVFAPINNIAMLGKGCAMGTPTMEAFPDLQGVEGYHEIVAVLMEIGVNRSTGETADAA